MGIYFYYLAILLEFLFAIGFSILTASFIYSSLKGSPYVPTRQKEIDKILKYAKLKPGQIFYELGCGDGRVARRAAQLYKVKSSGVDVNPILVKYANFLAKFYKIKNCRFIKQDIFATNLRQADILYLFLMPKLISSLVPKMEKELKAKTVIISHGFQIVEWKNKLYKKIEGKPFWSYYYRIG